MKRVILRKSTNYEFFQPNPSWDSAKSKKSYRHEDCPIRGICAATGKSWEEVYDIMAISGKEVHDAQTSDDSIKRTLEKLGYVKQSINVRGGGSRPTVNEFAEDHPEGSYILRVSHHVVGVRDGKFYDCWDCGNKCVYSYYEEAC